MPDHGTRRTTRVQGPDKFQNFGPYLFTIGKAWLRQAAQQNFHVVEGFDLSEVLNLLVSYY